MCGLEYCETCLPDVAIIAWTKGHQHRRPTFGDYAQRCVAERKRSEIYRRAKTEDPAFAMQFPEFIHEHRRSITGLKDFFVANFDRLVEQIPTFALYAETRRPTSGSPRDGKRARRRRSGKMRSWKRQSVHDFLSVERANTATILRDMLSSIGHEMPDWLFVPMEPTVDMKMAA